MKSRSRGTRDRDRDRRSRRPRHRYRSHSRSRSRSRSRSGRQRSDSKDRHRSSRRRRKRRDHSNGTPSRSRSKSSSRKKPSRSKSAAQVTEVIRRSTSAERAEKAKQKELMELTRDHRTVFIGQLTQKVRERDLEKYFNKVGKTEHVLLIRDKFTNRSKGFAYVEMSNLEDVPKVLLLNGQIPEFQIFPVMIKASEAEKNFAAKKDTVMTNTLRNSDWLGTSESNGSNSALAAAIASSMASGGSLSAASRIYCGNLHTNVTEDHLRVVFSSFGEVVSVNINRDEMGRSKGYGFIQFGTPQEANLSLSKGNGLELHGNFLRLGPVNENAGLGGMGMGSFSCMDGSHTWKLDDDEGAGMALNSQSRTALMAKLAGGKDIFPNPALGSTMYANVGSNAYGKPETSQTERAAALASEKIEGVPSFCFVVKNMFDAQAEKRSGNPDWHLEIQEDVVEECESFGPVLHSFVEKEKVGGLVYILFDRKESAMAAANRMHGRWFNKRQISVRFLSSQEYVGMFPEARSAVQTAKENSTNST